jgi:peptidyl-prolyl cis-trans isomerase C
MEVAVRASLLALTLLFACDTPDHEAGVPGQLDLGNDVLLTVNGHPVTQRFLDVGTRQLSDAQRENMMGSPDRKRELLDRIAFSELLYHRALDESLHKNPEVRETLALAQREILANLMLARIAEQAVTDEAIQARYESMAVQFNRPSAHVHHILVKKQDEANALVEQIRAGSLDFLEAAAQFSIDRTAKQNGGDLGWTMRAPDRALEQAWKEAEVNEVVGPIEGRMGFHIFRIVDRRDKTPIEEVRPKLAEMIKNEAMQNSRSELMNEAEIVRKDEPSEAVEATTAPTEVEPSAP